jgi:hypothetical protein
MSDDKKTSEDLQWNPLDTPQIANSEEAQRRLGRGAEMPGVYEADRARTEDGEEEKTTGERLQSIKENLNKIKQGMQEEAEEARHVMDNFKNVKGKDSSR